MRVAITGTAPYGPGMGDKDGPQRIEVLFTHESRTVEVELDGADDGDGESVVDLLVAAIEADDPDEAERQLESGLGSRGRVSRRP